MHEGIITIFKERRFVDYIAMLAYWLGLYETEGYWSIINKKTGEETGRHISIRGKRWIVKFLDWVTEYRGKDAVDIELEY